MLISLLLETIGILFVLILESFFFSLFSFSVVILFALLLINKLEWKQWVVLISLTAVFVDVILLRSIGTTLLFISVSSLVLYLLFLVMPEKQPLLSYIPYFLSIFLFYILLNFFSPFFYDGVIGEISWIKVINFLINSLISTFLIFIFNMLINRFRVKKDLLV